MSDRDSTYETGEAVAEGTEPAFVEPTQWVAPETQAQPLTSFDPRKAARPGMMPMAAPQAGPMNQSAPPSGGFTQPYADPPAPGPFAPQSAAPMASYGAPQSPYPPQAYSAPPQPAHSTYGHPAAWPQEPAMPHQAGYASGGPQPYMPQEPQAYGYASDPYAGGYGDQPQQEPAKSQSLFARFLPKKTNTPEPQADNVRAAVPTQAASRKPFLAGVLTGVVIMLGMGFLFGGEPDPTPAQFAPAPLADNLPPAEAPVAFLDEVQNPE